VYRYRKPTTPNNPTAINKLSFVLGLMTMVLKTVKKEPCSFNNLRIAANTVNCKKSTKTVQAILEIIKSILAFGEDVLISGRCKFFVKKK
jgi:hypothetical protein